MFLRELGFRLCWAALTSRFFWYRIIRLTQQEVSDAEGMWEKKHSWRHGESKVGRYINYMS
jgi:hypothetical protein